ncbi:hypothetical protein ACTHS9_27845 [Bacillus mycoides]|uniref:hypothetical protein n=1 Tax=Bacillus mycoides TaxID=1405 RepID=UPI003F7C2386
MIFFRALAYILLSIGIFTFVLAGVTVIVRKDVVMVKIHFFLAMYYLCSGSLVYLCTLWQTEDIFLQAFLIFSVGIAIIRLRKSWCIPQMRIQLENIRKQNAYKDDL